MSGLLCLKWNNHTSSILRKLNFILQKECYCDVTLVSQGNYYPVHRFVLSTCSEYFDEIFERSQCKHPFIILKDINVTELEALLNYMYNGEVNVLQETLPGLIKAAESLRIKGLAVQDESESDSPAPPPPPPPSYKGGRKRSYCTSPSSRSKRCRKKEEDEEESNTDMPEKELPPTMDETLDSSQVEESGSDLNNSNDSPTFRDPSQIADIPIKVETFEFEESNEDRTADFRADGNAESFPILETLKSPKDSLQDLIFDKTIVKTEEEFAQCSRWDEDDQTDSISDPHQGEMCELNPPSLGDRTLEAISLALSMHERISPAARDKSSSEAPSSSPSKSDKNSSIDLSHMMYECCYCPFISPVRSIWREHCFENHPGNHLYACKLCKYQTSVKSLLNRHMLVHNGEKRYKCDYCPYRTAYSFNMKTHLFKHKEVKL